MQSPTESTDNEGSPASGARRWRFSIRQLLLITTGVAITVGLVGSTYRWHLVKQRERTAQIQINPYGGVYTMASARYRIKHPEQGTSWFFNTFLNYVAEVNLALDNWNAEKLGDQATPLDDDAVAMLLSFPQLRRLDIRNAPVTDKCVDVLGRLQHLEYLDVRGTKVTSTGVSRLRDTLPDCVVEYESASQPRVTTE